jgi:hypothetical protein
MVYMMKAIEATGNRINSVFPLRTQIIPKHFRVDTTILIKLLYTNQNGKRARPTVEGSLRMNQIRISRDKSDVWGYFFKTNLKCFHMRRDKHHYTFHHQIETDGVSCSIILIRKDKAGQKMVKNPKRTVEEKYIDQLDDEELEELRYLRLVGIDPGMSDLLYCVDSDQPKISEQVSLLPKRQAF